MLRRSFLRCRQIFVKLSSLMTFKKKTVEGSMNSALACEQTSRGALAAGREKEGELATTSLELNSTSNFPVACLRLNCQISANQREAATNTNVNKHWKARAKDNDVITNVISANHHFASTFSMQILKFQRRIFRTLLPFRAPTPERLGELARRLILSNNSLCQAFRWWSAAQRQRAEKLGREGGWRVCSHPLPHPFAFFTALIFCVFPTIWTTGTG